MSLCPPSAQQSPEAPPPSISVPPHGHPCIPGLLGGALGTLEPGSWAGQASLHTEACACPEASVTPFQALLTAPLFQARSGAERLGLAGDLLSQLVVLMKN